MSKEPKHQATSHVEQGWQAWKATNPRVEWFPDLEGGPIRIIGSAVEKGQIVVINPSQTKPNQRNK